MVACDMAQAGLGGLQNVLQGPFGYFSVIEDGGDLTDIVAGMGPGKHKVWRITEMAHKPHPSGRATHGVIDAVLKLRADHGLTGADIKAVTLALPPMTHHLVARPVGDDMAINYARLCSPYVVALALRNGEIRIADFGPGALRDPEVLALAHRVTVEKANNPDPNALTPVEVAVTTTDGPMLRQEINIVLGNPDNPLTRDAHLAKFRQNAAGAAIPVPDGAVEALIAQVDALDTLGDIRDVIDNLCPSA
jgi:2-methylcitrate dehydratase PrpD